MQKQGTRGDFIICVMARSRIAFTHDFIDSSVFNYTVDAAAIGRTTDSRSHK